MNQHTQITHAIAWYRLRRPDIEEHLLRPWRIGEVTFQSLKVLQHLDAYVDLFEQGELSLGLAESYLLSVIRRFREGLKVP